MIHSLGEGIGLQSKVIQRRMCMSSSDSALHCQFLAYKALVFKAYTLVVWWLYVYS